MLKRIEEKNAIMISTDIMIAFAAHQTGLPLHGSPLSIILAPIFKQEPTSSDEGGGSVVAC